LRRLRPVVGGNAVPRTIRPSSRAVSWKLPHADDPDAMTNTMSATAAGLITDPDYWFVPRASRSGAARLLP
jgi:hypothetical protein